jgi:hypothetical protein
MIYIRFFVKLLMWGGIASLGWMCFSCKEFCEESNRTAVVVNFYSSTDNAAMTVGKFKIRGIENDSSLFDNLYKPTGSQVLLPVNPTSDFMSFSIKNDTLAIDTIYIRYIRHTGFISAECGCATFADIQETPEITDHTITRMVVVNPKVTTVSYRQGVVNDENIRIYY